MTREQQKLIYWLINDYSCYLASYSPGSKTSKYYDYLAKEQLKKLFLKHKNIKISEFKPFMDLSSFLDIELDKVQEKEITKDNIQSYIISNIQKLYISLDGGFSLALHMMTKENASDFLEWLFDYFLYNEIPFKKEIAELYAKQENEKYIFSMLKVRKCAVCGDNGADLEHWDSANSIGGYKFDDGTKTRFISLCRKHHQEKHNIEVIQFKEKYNLEGIYLNEKQVEILKKVYKNQFKGGTKDGR